MPESWNQDEDEETEPDDDAIETDEPTNKKPNNTPPGLRYSPQPSAGVFFIYIYILAKERDI